MNYAKFYTSAESALIDSLVSLWFRGKPQEQAYMRHILSQEEPLMAEPVFQSVFPWESSEETFAEHATKLGILTKPFVDALSSESVDAEQRFPKDRCPYKHQTRAWQTMLSGEGKTIVVTSGTGSGKTECFMIPVLQDIAARGEKGSVQAIFLYPLNALMKSQQKRIHAWCEALPEKVTYAIYNGDTEKEKKSKAFTDKYYPELMTRPQIRETPPQVLFTNPTMLNYMLVRSEDKEILRKSQGKLRWILLDEAHTYTGSSASELSLQLRRVLDAFGVGIDDVNFAVTSATIGDENAPATALKLKTFVSQLTGKDIGDIEIIGGRRIIPSLDKEKAQQAIVRLNERFGTRLTLPLVEELRQKLNTTAALSTSEIAACIAPKLATDRVRSLEIIDALADKVLGLDRQHGTAAALLPSRIHYFIRSINGVYACVNGRCSRHKAVRIGLGSLTTYQNTLCPECKARMLEVATCPSCGGLLVVGETSTQSGFRMHTNAVELDNDLFFETNDDLVEAETLAADDAASRSAAREDDAFTPFYFAKPTARCLRRHTCDARHVFNHETGRIELAAADADAVLVYHSLRHSVTNNDLCPHCGNAIGRLNYLRASASQMGRMLATTILDNADAAVTTDSEVLYGGKKFIAFTDNRQGSARNAMGLNQDVERAWIRSAIFHKLADIRLDRMVPSGLTSQEEEMLAALKQLPSEALAPVIKHQIQQLEAKKNGTAVAAPAPEVAWGEIDRTLENNADFRRLYKHLNEARGQKGLGNTSVYLKALLLDQFGWIPKRANSLETMGFVRLAYPALKRAQCPPHLMTVGCTDADWQDFLKICLDYVVRGSRHYMLSADNKQFVTQNVYSSAIYPKDSELRKEGKPVSKWPSVRRAPVDGHVLDTQHRLVLLLCAVLCYDDVDMMDEGQVAIVDSLLHQAWAFITANVLELTDADGRGYMLDLLGDKVRLQLIDKAYLCPVDNVVVDVAFRGYSPRMGGYIGRNNFNRFRIATSFTYPCFPFKLAELDDQAIARWMTENLAAQREHGVLSNLQKRVYTQRPIFIAAEHSAQQSREDLDKYEAEFSAGHLNILSCSTTMEMGVDIGGISEVVMNNVPPKSANYLQRAGRAGRRNESKAMALTFCAPNPIGTHTWQHPDYPITHLTATPLLKLESRQLVQRHVNALAFADFVARQGGIKVTARLRDFFLSAANGPSLCDAFFTYVDRIIAGQDTALSLSYERLRPRTAVHDVPLEDAVAATKSDFAQTYRTFTSRITSLDSSLRSAEEEGGKANALRAIQRQKDNFLQTSLLTYLAETSFLPSAGIPTGLVECMLNDTSKERAFQSNPTMHLSRAISAYAPGAQVVKNEWIYQPAGILLKTPYDDNTSRYVLQNCTHCGYTTITHGTALTDCPACGHTDAMHGIKNMTIAAEQRFTEVVEPVAFSTAFGTDPTRNMKGAGELNFIQPVLLEMEPWPKKTSEAKLTVRCSTPKSEILFYNRGRNGYGFAFCPCCGRMESEPSIDSSTRMLSRHRHLSTGIRCPGGENDGANVRRHVLLVGRYQTDFVELKFYNAHNALITDEATLYSLGVILSRKLTELLGVNDDEIDFGYNAAGHSVFIYDTALGGAGYSPLFREYKDEVLAKAREALASCRCERACTCCLIDRRSQWYINYLDRHKALEWLELEHQSSQAPCDVTALVPDAAAVTTDFATELSQLTRNADVRALRFFVDSDFDRWDMDAFPYARLAAQLRLAGTEVCFVCDRAPQLSSLSAPAMATLASVLLRHKFQSLQAAPLPVPLMPLLAVSFSDGRTKTYFAPADTDRSLAATWGNGQVYSSAASFPLRCADITAPSVLQQLAGTDGATMFDARITADGCLSSLLDALLSQRPEQWERIRPAFEGKTVSLTYSDRYLRTPLGCLLLAHFVRALQQRLGVTIGAAAVSTCAIRDDDFQLKDTALTNNFLRNSARNRFLQEAFAAIAGITPIVHDDGYIEHGRCLTLKAPSATLCIRPDGGIEHGWAPFGHAFDDVTDADIRHDWTADIPLYNRNQRRAGILYTISFERRG